MDTTGVEKEDILHVNKRTRRGFDINDDRWFSDDAIKKLRTAQEEIIWLLDRGYKISSIIELVGGRYQFSARQRLALQRASCSSQQKEQRLRKLIPYNEVEGKYLHIDGFNLIITLEVALSGSILILGNDGCLRDMAGLRGTYRLIDKTEAALELIGRKLCALKVKGARFLLDAPVSNSGRLKSRILEHAENWAIPVEVELATNPDTILSKLEGVATGDSVILDQCKSWINLSRCIIENELESTSIIDLNNSYPV